jgi:hypothetical protein
LFVKFLKTQPVLTRKTNIEMSENYDSDENLNEIDDDEIELDDDDLDEEDLEDSESMLEPQVKYLIYKDLYLNFWKSINLTQNIRNHLNLIHI